ncbi:hypothetical protein HDU77_002238 [Chytriomyces hyalinus]|nr:hypothetical protein HDU77_002238 [Chytriomyces hyalinus]
MNDLLSEFDTLSPKSKASALAAAQPQPQSNDPQTGLPLSPEESHAYGQLFSMAAVDNVVAADTAVSLLTRSKLPQNVLGEIWVLADSEQRGVLTRESFYKCMKLIALCQAGKPVSLQFIASKTALPVFDGVTITPYQPPAPVSAPAPLKISSDKGVAMAAQPSSTGFQLANEERDRFLAAFNSCSPSGGFVSGASAKELFIKSGLSLETLSRIWQLVDPQSTMQLSLAQFMMAMLIITQMKSGALQSVPPSIPPGLVNGIAAAAQSVSAQIASAPISVSQQPLFGSTGSTAVANSALPTSPLRMGSVTGTSASAVAPPPSFDKRRSTIAKVAAPVVPANQAMEPWAILADEKAISDSHFDSLDSGKKGYVSGQESYEFFLKSKLDQTTLAHIWELANIRKAVGLSKDEFSVAMHLIKISMAGSALPESLPTQLIPPSLRARPQASVAPAAPVPSTIPLQPATQPAMPFNSAPVVPKSATQDLMGLDAAFEPVKPQQPVMAAQQNTAFDTRKFSITAATPTATSNFTFPTNSLGTTQSPNSSLTNLSDDRSQEITAAQAQVADLEKRRAMLLPAQEELRAKRAANEIQLQKVNLRKQELILELTQASATYEAEQAILQENMMLLEREQAALAQSQMDVDQAKQIVAAKLDEKNQVLRSIEAVREEMGDCLKSVAEMDRVTRQYQEEITFLRPQFAQVHAELKKHLNQVEINKQLLASVTEEYQRLKMDVSKDEMLLEEEKRNLAMLENRVAVQSAINEKEKAKAQMALMSLSEVKGLSDSHAVSLSNLEAEVASGFGIPEPVAVSPVASLAGPAASSPTSQSQKMESVGVPAVPGTRAKPPPPPASRKANASNDMLNTDKRRSLTASVKSNETPATGPDGPPPMPPLFTKPKGGVHSSSGDLAGPVYSPVSAAVENAAIKFDTVFDADFESAFAAVPLTANKAALDDAFGAPSAASSSFDAAFVNSVATLQQPAKSADAFADAFSVPAPATKSSGEASAFADAFTLPPPPSSAKTASFADAFAMPPSASRSTSFADAFTVRASSPATNANEDFDKFKRPSLTGASLHESNGSIRSATARKRMTIMKKMDLDSEFANAFGDLAPPATEKTDSVGAPAVPFPGAAPSTAISPLAAQDAFSAIPTGDFNFDATFAPVSAVPQVSAVSNLAAVTEEPGTQTKASDMFADLDGAFSGEAEPKTLQPVVDHSFNAVFDAILVPPESKAGHFAAPTAAPVDTVDSLAEAFGTSPTLQQTTIPSAYDAFAGVDLNSAFAVPVAQDPPVLITATPEVAVEEVKQAAVAQVEVAAVPAVEPENLPAVDSDKSLAVEDVVVAAVAPTVAEVPPLAETDTPSEAKVGDVARYEIAESLPAAAPPVEFPATFAPAVPAPVSVPAPALASDQELSNEVKELMELGFPKEACIEALEKTGFNVEEASNYLIDGGLRENSPSTPVNGSRMSDVASETGTATGSSGAAKGFKKGWFKKKK